MASLTDWLRAANPLAAPTTIPTAERAARIGAVPFAAGGVQGILFALYVWFVNPTYMADQMGAALDRQAAMLPPEQIGMQRALMESTFMTDMMLWSTIFVSVVYLVLAVVQWRKLTRPIPVIGLCLAAYSLLSFLVGLAAGMVGIDTIRAASMIPMTVYLILHIASVRGAFALARLQRGA